MKWFSFSLIFNLSEEHFYFSNDEEGRLSCKLPIEMSLQEKNEGSFPSLKNPDDV